MLLMCLVINVLAVQDLTQQTPYFFKRTLKKDVNGSALRP